MPTFVDRGCHETEGFRQECEILEQDANPLPDSILIHFRGCGIAKSAEPPTLTLPILFEYSEQSVTASTQLFQVAPESDVLLTWIKKWAWNSCLSSHSQNTRVTDEDHTGNH